jgi:hypothetical protein
MDAFVPFVALAAFSLGLGWVWGWAAAWRCIGEEDRKALMRDGLCNPAPPAPVTASGS